MRKRQFRFLGLELEFIVLNIPGSYLNALGSFHHEPALLVNPCTIPGDSETRRFGKYRPPACDGRLDRQELTEGIVSKLAVRVGDQSFEGAPDSRVPVEQAVDGCYRSIHLIAVLVDLVLVSADLHSVCAVN